MSGIILPPQFVPPQAPISIGTNGQVLTNVSGRLKMAAAGGGGGTVLYPGRTSIALAAGGNDLAFAFTQNTRIFLTAPSGDAIINTMTAGSADGQGVLLICNEPTHQIQIAVGGAGALQPFFGISGGMFLSPQGDIVGSVYDTTLNQWLLVP